MKKTTIYRRPMDENLFEEELTIEALSAMGNPLEQLSALVDFEMFRPELEDILVKKDCKSTAGRPQFDVVLMFKVIFLQRYYGLGDKQIPKLIEKYVTTDASVHDSNVIDPLIEEKDNGQPLYLDAGYEAKDDVVREWGMIPVICEKGHRNHPLTDEQKQNNRQKSKIRCRVEHIFGFIEGAMNGSFVRSIGIVRAKAATALTCLVYNIFRYVQINKYQPQLIASMG